MTDYLRKGVKGTFFVLIFTLLAAVAGYLTRIFLARTLSATDYGLFYSVFTVSMFIAIFTDLGYTQALVKFIPEFIVQKKDKLINQAVSFFARLTIILSLIFGVALFFSASFLATYYFKSTAAEGLLYIFILILLLNSLLIFEQTVFQAFQDMFKYGLIYALSKIFFFIFIVIIFFSGIAKGAAYPTWAYLLSVLVTIILFAIPFLRKAKLTFRGRTDKQLFNKMTSFAIPNSITAIAGTVIGYIDTIILTYLVPLSLVGVYNAVLPTVLIVPSVIGVASAVFFPMVSEFWSRKDHSRLSSGLSIIYKYVLSMIMPIALAMLFFSSQIMRIFFGESFVAGATSLMILSLSTIFLVLAQTNFSVIAGCGHPKRIMAITLFAAAFNTIFNILLIPVMGINGSALTTALSYLIMFVWSFILVKRMVSFKVSGLLAILLSSGAFLICLFALNRLLLANVLLKITLSLIISTALYVLLLIALKAFSIKEIKHMLLHIIKR